MSTSSYTLRYFNGRGLAEVARLLFALAGVSYEDERVQATEADRSAWLAIKEEQTFGKLPVLIVDGQTVAQSRSIERFLAKRFGFVGSSEFETAQIDSASEQIRDIAADWYPARSDEEKANTFFSTNLPSHLKYLERFSCDNGHIVGSSITVADVSFYYVISTLGERGIKELEQYPKLKKVHDQVLKNERIQAWIAKRPQTAF
jgi:glutathione S-transferase